MSIAAMKAVFDHSLTRNGARLVMLALADVADDEGVIVYADYSLGDIAAKCNLSERQVTTIIAAVEGGELAVERGTGRGNTHQYKILLPGLEQAPHRRRKGEKTSPFPEAAPEPEKKDEVSRTKDEVSSEKGEVISGPLRKDHSTNYHSPLPPSAPQAAALPAGEAGGGLGLDHPGQAASAAPDGKGDRPPEAASTRSGESSREGLDQENSDPFTRYRAAIRAAFGAAIFESWFGDLDFDGLPAPDASGRLTLGCTTASAVRADRIAQQFARGLSDIWERVIGPPGAAPRVVVRVDPLRERLAAERREAERRAAAAAREAGGDRPGADRAGQNRKGRRYG